MNFEPGLRLDRYVLSEPLGEGGQGAVWKATDPLLPDTPVALKLVAIRLASSGALERARREARALAELDHPSLVRCHGLFEDLKHGVLGVAMDWIAGTSLKALAADERLDDPAKLAVLGHVAHALEYLHQKGLVHRDVKLDNVLVRDTFWQDPTRPDGVKLVDLGIARSVGSDRDLTEEGTVIGTLSYLAPEVLDGPLGRGLESSPTVDVFAFGVMGWLMLAKTHPTGLPRSASAVELALAYRSAATTPGSFPKGTLGEPLSGVLTRCLALDPKERLADGSAIIEALGLSSPDSVVVRPSKSGKTGVTAVATPRAMRDDTALAADGASASSPDAITREIGGQPTQQPAKRSALWLPLATLLLAGGAGVAIVRSLPGPSPTPSSSSSAAAPPSREPRKPPSPPSAAMPNSSEPAPSAPVPVADASPTCACPSGRGCGDEGCSAPLEFSDNYALRVGRVDADDGGASVLSTYRTAELCVALAGAQPVCMPLQELEDGGISARSVNVSYRDLIDRGLDVQLDHKVPGAGSTKLAWKRGVKLDGSPTRALLCRGLVIEGLETAPDVSVRRVVLYLDDPESVPTRCP